MQNCLYQKNGDWRMTRGGLRFGKRRALYLKLVRNGNRPTLGSATGNSAPEEVEETVDGD